MPLGARGMYQRKAALERAAGDLFKNLWRSERSLSRRTSRFEAVLGSKSVEGQRWATKGSVGNPPLRNAGQHSPADALGATTNLGDQAVTDTFDLAVVGGGPGGCAVASRLSEDSGTFVALAGSRAAGMTSGWSPRRRAGFDGRRQGQQLGARDGAAGGPQRPKAGAWSMRPSCRH
jgi:hypothetical protein